MKKRFSNSLTMIAVILSLVCQSTVVHAQSLFQKDQRILFQGDSITDMGRGRTEDPNHLLGHGYAFIIAAKEAAEYPELRLTFINRGIGGNQTTDLLARWQKDTLDLKPDVLSLLIGVNDLAYKLRMDQPFFVDDYEKHYDALLSQSVTALPKIKLVLCEPFFAPGKVTADRLDQWQQIIPQMQAVVQKLADKYHAPVVHCAKVFTDAEKRAPISYWIWDGVHPTYAGHQLLADEWRKVYRNFYDSPNAANP